MTEQEFHAYMQARAKAGTLKPMPVFPTREQVRGKYGNKPTIVCGEQFDSGAEAQRYEDLLLLERAGKITQLRHHVRYPLEVNGIPICEYEADFTYKDENELLHVEDVKCNATRTPAYRIKRQLMAAVHGITIEEIMTDKHPRRLKNDRK